MNLLASLYRAQINVGRYFLYEHPACATSWDLPSMSNLVDTPDVFKVVGDQYKFFAEAVNGRVMLRVSRSR